MFYGYPTSIHKFFHQNYIFNAKIYALRVFIHCVICNFTKNIKAHYYLIVMPNLSFCIFKQKKFLFEFEDNIWIIYDVQSASSNLGKKHKFGHFYSHISDRFLKYLCFYETWSHTFLKHCNLTIWRKAKNKHYRKHKIHGIEIGIIRFRNTDCSVWLHLLLQLRLNYSLMNLVSSVTLNSLNKSNNVTCINSEK